MLTSLGTGQAVVSVLDDKGRPAPVAPTVVDAPASVMGPAREATVAGLLASSPLAPRYSTAVDNESAYEMLAARVEQQARAAREAEEAAKEQAKAEAAAQKEAARRRKETERLEREAIKEAERRRREAERAAQRRQREIEKTVGSVGRQITRELTRSVFGTLRRR